MQAATKVFHKHETTLMSMVRVIMTKQQRLNIHVYYISASASRQSS